MRIVDFLNNMLRLILFWGIGFAVAGCASQAVLQPIIALPVATAQAPFDGARAFQDVITQLDFGPRTPGSEAHAQMVTWMQESLVEAGWEVSVQEAPYNNYTIQNVVARRGQGRPWIILGAHYDTRFYADSDPNPANFLQPVMGANDGASGVAVLLEMARVLPEDLPGEVWLVFFDAEDQGRIWGWDWILGSRAFVESLASKPDAAVIVDMIGDADLQIYWEQNSDLGLTREIWGVAETLGYADTFIASPRHTILDDHIPFLEAGIPAVDLIDFDYPYYHTVSDTLDKVSPRSLQIVGDVLLHWLLTKLSMGAGGQ